VTLKGTTVILDSPAFYFDTLRLEDSKFVTRGQNITIEAVRIEAAGNASVNSYLSTLSSTPSSSGGQLKLIVYDRILGQLSIDLSGTVGSKGADGRNGVVGAGGVPGENSAQRNFPVLQNILPVNLRREFRKKSLRHSGFVQRNWLLKDQNREIPC